jgi:hypothetical protein
MDEKIKYILKFGIFLLFVFAIINIMGIDLNNGDNISQNNSLIEGLQPGTLNIQPGTLNIQPGTLNLPTGADSFCATYIGASGSLNNECKRLTEKNCNETSCCVFTNNKCVAGNANGPIYNTNSSGKTITADYYFQNQCYGANCPS